MLNVSFKVYVSTDATADAQYLLTLYLTPEETKPKINLNAFQPFLRMVFFVYKQCTPVRGNDVVANRTRHQQKLHTFVEELILGINRY